MGDLQNNNFLKFADADALSSLPADIADLEKTKYEVKTLIEISTSKLLFYKYLSKNQDERPIDDAADNSLTKASEELKESIDKEEENIKELSEEAAQSNEILQKNIAELKSTFNSLQEKVVRLTDIKTKQEDIWSKILEKPPKGVSLKQLKENKENKLKSVIDCLLRCDSNVKSVKEQISSLEQSISQTQSKSDRKQNDSNIDDNATSTLLKNTVTSLKTLVSDQTHLSGVKVQSASDKQIILEFLNSCGQQDDPRLILTINFEEDNSALGNLWIKSAEVNTDSFEVDDIIQTAIKFNDVPLLIQKLKQRWLTHFPLASEMKIVAEHHAVDWMQEEGMVRVLVGRGGSIICTLQMPKTYPSSGDVTLVNAQGLPNDVNTEDLNPPVGQRNILGWVKYLENMFGRP